MNQKMNEKLYIDWWKGLSGEKKSVCESLKLQKNKGGNSREYFLERCREILDLIFNLKNCNDKWIVPIGVTVQGKSPVVYIKTEKSDNGKYLNGCRIVLNRRKDGKSDFFSSIDTSEYGLPAKKSILFMYRVESHKSQQ